MNYNYHAHTTRCGHATGTPREYIEYAIANGVKYMGFSDHCPYICPNGKEASYRVPMAQAKDYIAELAALREEYKDRIDLKIGFEMEYYPQEFEKMLQTAIDLGAEYLIMGEHFTRPESPGGVHTMQETTSEEALWEYANCLAEGMKTGAFTYVAHPDLINYVGDRENLRKAYRVICEAAVETGVPMEINFLGIRDGRNYPNMLFWEVAGETQAPVTFGFDAHSTEHAYDGASLVKAQEMVKTYGLNYVGMPRLRLLIG